MAAPATQPFVMPALALPTDARINPHRATAAEHATVWAREMGMLGDAGAGMWTEKDLRSHDYPLMCAYSHPDADADELALITQWYTWIFFFDDYFLQRFKKTGDRDAAIAHLDRTLAVLAGADPAADASPVETALADLWARSLPGMSESWRDRFTAVTAALLEDSLVELDSITAHRVPGPIEYIELRRRVGGAPWSAALVEHTVGELPARLVGTRPVRVLTDTFADAVHLRNDLFSYQREIGEEGEPHNAVLVVEEFLGCPTQRAADMVADLLTSRLRLFEHVVAFELPELLSDCGADTRERARVAAYVQGLRDWQAGGHEWHTRSSRYMNAATRNRPAATAVAASGPGTSPARLVRPVTGLSTQQQRVTGPLPALGAEPRPSVPFTLRVSPHLDHLRAHARRWCMEMGMLDPVPGLPRSHVWTEQDVIDFDIALCAASVFYDSPRHELEVVCNWLHLTYIDDLFPAVYTHRPHAEAKAFIASLLAQIEPGHRPVPHTPAERMVRDLWDATMATLPADRHAAQRTAARAWILSNLWEHHYAHTRTIPDPVDFVEMARSTFGGDFMLAMVHARHTAIPDDVYAATPMRVLDATVLDIFRLLNEPASYTKETQFEDETLNALTVLGQFLGLNVTEANAAVVALLDSRITQMQRVIDHELPALCQRRHLTPDVTAGIGGYTDTMRSWVAAVANWHRATHRYTPRYIQARYARLRDRALAGPRTTGLMPSPLPAAPHPTP